MAAKRGKPEDFVLKLWQVEVLQGPGLTFADTVRQMYVAVQTYFCWRGQNGGVNQDQLKRLK